MSTAAPPAAVTSPPFSATWVGTGAGAVACSLALIWSIAVFHRHQVHRSRWLPIDLLLVALLWQSLVQQGGAALYAVLAIAAPGRACSATAWLLVGVHALQAATLATLAVTRLLRARVAPASYAAAVTGTHLAYHLVSLTLLASCVGVTAVLARAGTADVANEECTFLPHELDSRYGILSLALHATFLATSVLAVISTCCIARRQPQTSPSATSTSRRGVWHQQRKQQLLFTSSSDLSSALSEFSSASAARGAGKAFWNGGAAHDANCDVNGVGTNAGPPSITFLNGLPPGLDVEKDVVGHGPLSALRSLDSYGGTPHFVSGKKDQYRELCSGNYSDSTLNRHWTSDASYMSTTTSPTSTNSRAPCLARPTPPPMSSASPTSQLAQLAHLGQLRSRPGAGPEEEEVEPLRLRTAGAVLAICYVCNHVPVLALSAAAFVRPSLIPSWVPLHAACLWAPELQAALLPLTLAFCDARFAPWRRQEKRGRVLEAKATSAEPQQASGPQPPPGASQHAAQAAAVAQAAAQIAAGRIAARNAKYLPFEHDGVLTGSDSLERPPCQLAEPGTNEPPMAVSHQEAELQQQNQNNSHSQTPKFPITNGSLFTSLDGHIPIVHNYRRRRDMQMGTTYLPVHSSQPAIVHPGCHAHTNLALAEETPSSNESTAARPTPAARNHLLNHHLLLPHRSHHAASSPASPTSPSQPQHWASADQLAQSPPDPATAHDFILGALDDNHLLRRRFGADLGLSPSPERSLHQLETPDQSLGDSANDDDDDEPIYATLSSGCSVTTAANDDFEYYQHLGGASRDKSNNVSTSASVRHKSKKPRLNGSTSPPRISSPTSPPSQTQPSSPSPALAPPPPAAFAGNLGLEPDDPCMSIPGYKKRQGFHEVELAHHAGTPLSTAELLQVYQSSTEGLEQQDSCSSVTPRTPTITSKSSSSSSPEMSRPPQKRPISSPPASGIPNGLLSEYFSQPRHRDHSAGTSTTKSTSSSSSSSSPGDARPSEGGDGRGIYSYHDVIRGCKLEDLKSAVSGGPPQPPAPQLPTKNGPLPKQRAILNGSMAGSASTEAIHPRRSRRHHGQKECRRQTMHPNTDSSWPNGASDASTRRKMSLCSLDGLDAVDGDILAVQAHRPPPHPRRRQPPPPPPPSPPPHQKRHHHHHHHYHHQSRQQRPIPPKRQSTSASMSSVASPFGSRDPLLASGTSLDSVGGDSVVGDPPDAYGYPRRHPRGYHKHPTPTKRAPHQRRTHRQQKKAVARVLSLDSLHLALQDAGTVSYLDTGDVYSHHVSQPDLHRVFVSDFI